MIVVVVFAVFTVCAAPADTQPLKSASPAYVAVSVLAPALVKVIVHFPAATVPVQLSVPSLTVTFPVGCHRRGVTEYSTVTDWPTTDGSGVSPVIVVVVSRVHRVRIAGATRCR